MTSILVVDDQKAQRKNLAFYLKSQNFEVDTSESGEEALGKIESGYFDVVIADYKLEGMNGQEFMHLAQKKQPALEFIIMTAFGSIPLAIDFVRLIF
jgi:two-component system nitrogen regulation response regulator NtrX